MIDADLAALYGVDTRTLNQAVKRNAGRFPPDFMFQLDAPEKAEVITNCDHLAKLKFSSALPYAFTEYGAVALANVFASSQAVEMGIYLVRAFVRLRQAAGLHEDLAKRLAANSKIRLSSWSCLTTRSAATHAPSCACSRRCAS